MTLSTRFQAALPPFSGENALEWPRSRPRGARGRAATPPTSRRKAAANPGSRRVPRGEAACVTFDEIAGVVEIRDPRLLRRDQEAFCRALVESAVTRYGATRAAISFEGGTCRLEFAEEHRDRGEMAHRATSAVHAAIPAIRRASSSRSPGIRPGTATRERAIRRDPAEDATARRRRGAHAVQAGGSLALAVGAAILPGLPTLPFLIMTGRHAALASPRIGRWLRRLPWAAALLDDENAPVEPTIDWRSLSRTIGLTVLFVAGIWVLHPPLPVVLVLEVALMVFLAFSERLGSRRADAGRLAVA